METPTLTLAVWPAKAMYHPGEEAVIDLTVTNASDEAIAARLLIQISALTRIIHEHQTSVTLSPGEFHYALPLMLPEATLQGYGVDVTIVSMDGAPLATESTAVDVLSDWTQAPRYGFLSDFAPGDEKEAATVVAHLNRAHINVAQFYDWMWRHYVLMPPEPTFTDALGRRLSLEAVRAKAAACHTHNIATMGYAAVYGAEPEYSQAHPDEVLYDAEGKPHNLLDLFDIMNIHRSNPWREQILREMARATVEVPFDGLHLDQYGFPTKDAFGPAPERQPYDLAEDFPDFIDAARLAIQQPGEEKSVIFNAVRNWPIDEVANTTQDAVYIEVWPPYEGYGDLQSVITHAQSLAPTKQVIIAAYMKPLQGSTGDIRDQAVAATRLTTATIWANGGFHLILGETDGALEDAYYPDYVPLAPSEITALRKYWDFVVRYEAVLADRQFTLISDPAFISDPTGLISTQAEAGKVWAIPRQMSRYLTVSLLNLTHSPQAHWNALTPIPEIRHDLPLRVRLDHDRHVTAAYVASPDDDTRPLPLDWAITNDANGRWVEMTIPRLEYWQLLVLETDH